MEICESIQHILEGDWIIVLTMPSAHALCVISFTAVGQHCIEVCYQWLTNLLAVCVQHALCGR